MLKATFFLARFILQKSQTEKLNLSLHARLKKSALQTKSQKIDFIYKVLYDLFYLLQCKSYNCISLCDEVWFWA